MIYLKSSDLDKLVEIMGCAAAHGLTAEARLDDGRWEIKISE